MKKKRFDSYCDVECCKKDWQAKGRSEPPFIKATLRRGLTLYMPAKYYHVHTGKPIEALRVD